MKALILAAMMLLPLAASAETMCKTKDAKGTTVYTQGECLKGKEVRVFPNRPTAQQIADADSIVDRWSKPLAADAQARREKEPKRKQFYPIYEVCCH